MIFINFKTYKEGTGQSAVKLSQILGNVARNSQIKIIPVVQSADVKEVASSTTLEVWVQKVDAVSFGAHTGSILPEAVVEDGAAGVFINHSEAKLNSPEEIRNTVNRASEAGLKTLVFAGSLEELGRVLEYKPTLVAYEPPALVGSKDTSVAKEEPDIIAKAVIIAKEKGIPLVIGAGIKSREDIVISLQLGAAGVAVASDVVTSENPEAELNDLVEGFGQL